MIKTKLNRFYIQNNCEIKGDIRRYAIMLLRLLGTSRDKEVLKDVLNSQADAHKLKDLFAMMETLGYSAKPIRRHQHFSSAVFPVLCVTEDQQVLLLRGMSEGEVEYYDYQLDKLQCMPLKQLKGYFYNFKEIVSLSDLIDSKGRVHFIRYVFSTFKGLAWQIMLINLFVTLFSLATPFYLMSVYAKVMHAGSMGFLLKFSIGAMITILGIMLLLCVRRYMLSYVSSFLQSKITNSMLSKLLFLPSHLIESASVNAQVSRMRDLNTISDFMNSNVVTTLLELPFVIIFIIAIAVIAKGVVFIPMVAIILYCLLGALFLWLLMDRVESGARFGTLRNQLLMESFVNKSIIDRYSMQGQCLDRYQDTLSNTVMYNYKNYITNQSMMAIGNLLFVLSGLAVLIYATLLIMNQQIMPGALIASMILIWRVLAPARLLMLSIGRISAFRASILQLKSVLSLQSEDATHLGAGLLATVKGELGFSHATMRYPNASVPSLLNIDLKILPGTLVSITGKTGAGKSTLLKVVMGICPLINGSAYIDGHDIRQLHVRQLRRAIAYVPQSADLFSGSIVQNLLLANPSANEAAVVRAAKLTGLYEDVMRLPKGFKTIVSANQQFDLSQNLLRKIVLTRAFMKDSKILLFDEVLDDMDYDPQLMQTLFSKLKNHFTVLIVTRKKSVMKLTDQLILLEKGAVKTAGPTAKIVPSLGEDIYE